MRGFRSTHRRKEDSKPYNNISDTRQFVSTIAHRAHGCREPKGRGADISEKGHFRFTSEQI